MLPFFKLQKELTVVQGLVLRNQKTVPQTTLLRRIMDIAHKSHPAIGQTKQTVRPLLEAKSACDNIPSCIACQKHDKIVYTAPASMQPVPFPTGAWKQSGIDFVGSFTSFPGHRKYAITAADYFSKWPEVGFCSHKELHNDTRTIAFWLIVTVLLVA